MPSLPRAILLLPLLALSVFAEDQGSAPANLAPVRFPAVVEPRNDIRIDNRVPVRMRDGVTLYADVYRPVGRRSLSGDRVASRRYSTERFPSAYDAAVYFAQRGYVYVFQDVRGRHESEGVWEPFFNDEKDGVRHDRVGGEAAVVERQGRDAGRLLPGTEPVARGPGRAAQPGDDLPDRGLHQHLPRLDHAQRRLAPVVQLRLGPDPAGVAHHAEPRASHGRRAPRDSLRPRCRSTCP